MRHYIKVLSGGRCDARLVSAFAALYAGSEGAAEAGEGAQLQEQDLSAAHRDIATRCGELLRALPTTVGRGKSDIGLMQVDDAS